MLPEDRLARDLRFELPSWGRFLHPLLLLTLLPMAPPAWSQDRLVRRFPVLGGVPVGSVRSLAQDSSGFIWVGTVGGLLRWDGTEMRRWAPERITSWVNALPGCPDGRLYAVEEGGHLFQIEGDSARRVSVPGGVKPVAVMSARCDGANKLWITTNQALLSRSADGRWQEVAPGRFVGAGPLLLSGPPGAGGWLRAANGLWRIEPNGSVHLRLADIRANSVAIGAAGDTLVLASDRGLVRLAGATTPVVVPPLGRAIAVARRGQTVWATFDRFVVAVSPGSSLVTIGPADLPEGGGPLLVDREESLWLGTFSGLLQWPEPETVVWNDRHGLPSAHSRFVAPVGSRVWVGTWQGLGRIDAVAGWFVGSTMPAPWHPYGSPFVGADDVVWVGTTAGLREIRGERTVRIRPFDRVYWDAAPAPDGGLWLASADGLLHAPANGSPVRPVVGSPFGPGVIVRQILQTRSGDLWLAGDERICHRRGPAVSSADWDCTTIPGAVEVTGLVELPSGAVWAASSRLGVWRFRDGRFEPMPANAQLDSRAVYRLVPAPGGSIWVLGFATPIRVREAPASEDGWEVLESLAAGQGVPAEGQDLAEASDGALWLATSLGVARIPSEAREVTAEAPPVALVSVVTDGRPGPATGVVRLRHRHNRIDLRFAALSFRDPGRVRYQARLFPDEQWSDRAGPPSLSWIDLPAGHYRAEVRASLDGRVWTKSPAGFAIEVAAPWYLQAWALILGALAVAAAAVAVHRARLVVVLGLERQRTRIAMDLHDEMGAGLGSIGILSGVLATEELDPLEQRRIAARIAETSGELSGSLSDIVWALGPRSGTLDEIVARLAEHGARLFASGEVAFEAKVDEGAAAIRLDSGATRAVLLIGLEAMHNAARHAGPTRVELGVTVNANSWTMTVDDDGRGGATATTGTGRGLDNIRRRAEELGGRASWDDRPGGGTRLMLRVERHGRR